MYFLLYFCYILIWKKGFKKKIIKIQSIKSTFNTFLTCNPTKIITKKVCDNSKTFLFFHFFVC